MRLPKDDTLLHIQEAVLCSCREFQRYSFERQFITPGSQQEIRQTVEVWEGSALAIQEMRACWITFSGEAKKPVTKVTPLQGLAGCWTKL